MNRQAVRHWIPLSVFLIASVALTSLAEARPGGGRSSGFRGSRGFGTRSAPAQQYRYQGGQQPGGGFSQQQARPGLFGGSGSGNFMRGMAGGLAGGMIGSMLFGGMGRAGGLGGGLGGGGVGLMDIVILLGLGYMAYRFFQRRKQATAGGQREMGQYERLQSVEPGPYASGARAQSSEGGEHACVETLARYDSSFNPEVFKEQRMDDFMKLQAAWNHRDLSSVSNLVAPELRNQLDADVDQLKARRQINRIDNIAVRGSELVEAWQERGQEYATVRFRANLVDYTVDELTGQVVAGDRAQPVKFEEDWTFVRSIDGRPGVDAWKITAIEA